MLFLVYIFRRKCARTRRKVNETAGRNVWIAVNYNELEIFGLTLVCCPYFVCQLFTFLTSQNKVQWNFSHSNDCELVNVVISDLAKLSMCNINYNGALMNYSNSLLSLLFYNITSQHSKDTILITWAYNNHKNRNWLNTILKPIHNIDFCKIKLWIGMTILITETFTHLSRYAIWSQWFSFFLFFSFAV